MKVVKGDKSNNVFFSSLKSGDTFLYSTMLGSMADLFMRVADSHSAVRLIDGAMYQIHTDSVIKVCDAKVIYYPGREFDA